MISDRNRLAARSRQHREDVKEVVVPDCADRGRRERYEADDIGWLMHYFGDGSGVSNPFWYEFTAQQVEMIEAIRHAIRYGGDQAIAASRGEGKTTICERLLLKYTLQGVIGFPVLFSATAESARNSLATIKLAIESNDRLLADYPEICAPVRALENTPQRAKYQTVTGRQHDDRRRRYTKAEAKYSWCGSEIVFPHTPGAPAAGAIIATRGLDSGVRGLKIEGRRPDVAIIDDPDTADTARSEDQAAKLIGRINKDIGGLGGQQRGIARVVLTTLQSRVSASYQLTDRTLSPTWKPKRFRFLVTPPDRTDLWDEYVAMRQQDFGNGDEFARRSFEFYRKRKKKMEAGAVVANPNRYDGQELPDGLPNELTALQRYYNEVARIGAEAVATEYNNDPPEETGLMESAITPGRIMRQLSGYPRGVVPDDCTVVVQGIDVGKMALHWVVRAWRGDCVGYTIDHGVQEVYGTVVGSDEGLDVAIRRAIHARWEASQGAYATAAGELRPIDCTVVDARYRTDAVYAACRELGKGNYPGLGFGRSQGCVRATFMELNRRVLTPQNNMKPGDGWRLVSKSGVWVAEFDADKWKAWEHDRWMTDPPTPGSLQLFGSGGAPGERMSDDEKAHHSYAHHICNEKEVEEVVDGALKRYWKSRGNNHWLDASAMSNVAASMAGIRLIDAGRRVTTVKPAAAAAPAAGRRSLREMATSGR